LVCGEQTADGSGEKPLQTDPLIFLENAFAVLDEIAKTAKNNKKTLTASMRRKLLAFIFVILFLKII
jgi:hypothetical protein